MSGLLSGLLLRRAGWDVDIYERVESELSGRGAGIVAQAELIERLRKLGLATDELGVAITTRKILDAQGRADPRDRMPAGAHRLGARLPAAARRLSARALSPRARARRLRARRRSRCGAFFRWRKRSRPICWSAPTASARPCASNPLPDVLPLYAGYSAWRALIAESAIPARRASRPVRIHDVQAAAGRAVPRLSGGGARQRSAPRPPPLQRGVVPAGRRDRPSCNGCSPTRAA